jgi:hypothetical protein
LPLRSSERIFDDDGVNAMRPALDDARRLADALVMMIALRLLYTVAVMSVVIWLLRSGNPIGGLFIVPAAAVWLRRAAESGRLAARTRRTLRH